MKKIMRFGLVLCCFMCMSMFMFGCDKKEDVTADYPDEKVFETALVDGEDLEGKTVDIVVSNLETKSVYPGCCPCRTDTQWRIQNRPPQGRRHIKPMQGRRRTAQLIAPMAYQTGLRPCCPSA